MRAGNAAGETACLEPTETDLEPTRVAPAPATPLSRCTGRPWASRGVLIGVRVIGTVVGLTLGGAFTGSNSPKLAGNPNRTTTTSSSTSTTSTSTTTTTIRTPSVPPSRRRPARSSQRSRPGWRMEASHPGPPCNSPTNCNLAPLFATPASPTAGSAVRAVDPAVRSGHPERSDQGAVENSLSSTVRSTTSATPLGDERPPGYHCARRSPGHRSARLARKWPRPRQRQRQRQLTGIRSAAYLRLFFRYGDPRSAIRGFKALAVP